MSRFFLCAPENCLQCVCVCGCVAMLKSDRRCGGHSTGWSIAPSQNADMPCLPIKSVSWCMPINCGPRACRKPRLHGQKILLEEQRIEDSAKFKSQGFAKFQTASRHSQDASTMMEVMETSEELDDAKSQTEVHTFGKCQERFALARWTKFGHAITQRPGWELNLPCEIGIQIVEMSEHADHSGLSRTCRLMLFATRRSRSIEQLGLSKLSSMPSHCASLELAWSHGRSRRAAIKRKST